MSDDERLRPNGSSISIEREAVRVVEIALLARKNRLYAAEYRERGQWGLAHSCDRVASTLDALWKDEERQASHQRNSP